MNDHTNFILTPEATQLDIEAILHDVTYLEHPNFEGLYTFSFVPSTATDMQLLFEAIESALSDVKLNSYEDVKDRTEDRNGMPVCSQYFQPKLNLDTWNVLDSLLGEKVSLNLHLKDDAYGNVYLQCSFVDFYETLSSQIDVTESKQLVW